MHHIPLLVLLFSQAVDFDGNLPGAMANSPLKKGTVPFQTVILPTQIDAAQRNCPLFQRSSGFSTIALQPIVGRVGRVFTRLTEVAVAVGLVKTRPTLPCHDRLTIGWPIIAVGLVKTRPALPLGDGKAGRSLQRVIQPSAKPAVLVLVSASETTAPGVMIDKDRLARLQSATISKFNGPLLFDSPQADAILSAMEVFPPDNPWNIPVDEWPVAANSTAMV